MNSKKQRYTFAAIMSVTMAFGMEVYNIILKGGFELSTAYIFNTVILTALKETVFMGIIVFIISNYFGNRAAQKLSAKIKLNKNDSEKNRRRITQGCTVCIMCPIMSLVASIIFKVILAGGDILNLPVIWAQTFIKNLPMAILWSFLIAAPLTRFIVKNVYTKRNAER